MKKTIIAKSISLVLSTLLLIFSCFIFEGCSVEKYLEKGDFEKAYERALKDKDEAMQEEILCKSALYGALHCSDKGMNSSTVVCAAYYLIHINLDGDVSQFVVLEYEDVLSITKEEYSYKKYVLYRRDEGSSWKYEGYDNILWYESRDRNREYEMNLESSFSFQKTDMDIAYVVNDGKKFTADEIKQMENRLEEYKQVIIGKDIEFSFVVREEVADVKRMLQGKWDLNKTYYTLADLMCYIDGDTYRAAFEDSEGNSTHSLLVSEGTIEIEEKRIVLKNSSGAMDFELFYEVYHGKLIMFRKESTKYSCVAKIS